MTGRDTTHEECHAWATDAYDHGYADGLAEQIRALAEGADERRKTPGVPDDLTALAGRVASGNSTTFGTDWCECPKATRRHFATDRCWPRVRESVMDNAACTCPIIPVQHRATVYCQEAPDA